MARGSGEKRGGSAEMIAAIMLMIGGFVFMTWLVSSHRIVYASMQAGLIAGAMWKLVPGELGVRQWNWLVEWIERGLPRLADVGILEWATFVNVAFLPLAVTLMVLHVPVLYLLVRARKSVQRRITPDGLIRMMSAQFTGNIPIMAIRQKIAADKLPKWRLAVQPEEVLQKWRVPRNSARPEWVGKPICNLKKGAFDDDVARLYFLGLRVGTVGNDRMVSDMLGRQIVNLVRDAEHAGKIVFADRCSPMGKALIALWAPVCFNGEKGRQEYQALKDALNRSCYGSADGEANLAVAQEQYDRYRDHPQLRQLFAVHHWEYTILFALLKRAQRFAVITTAETLWMRPMNRVLYAALNSCGRRTPHLEGAAVFAMHRFEHECQRLGRLPLVPVGPNGELAPSIFVEKAVMGLREEFLHLVDAEDDEDDIWANKELWHAANAAVNDWSRQAEGQARATIEQALASGEADMDNEFDMLMAAQAAEAGRRSEARVAQAMAGARGGPMEGEPT